jgi:hypothetical protein
VPTHSACEVKPSAAVLLLLAVLRPVLDGRLCSAGVCGDFSELTAAVVTALALVLRARATGAPTAAAVAAAAAAAAVPAAAVGCVRGVDTAVAAADRCACDCFGVRTAGATCCGGGGSFGCSVSTPVIVVYCCSSLKRCSLSAP